MSATSTLRKTYSALRQEWTRLQIRLHPIRFSPDVGAASTIYFLTPDHNVPSGGIRVIYDHVDTLNREGVRASILHTAANFRCTWFKNSTVVNSIPAVVLHANDLLVIPEVEIARLAYLPAGLRHLIFSQSAQLTWQIGGRLLSSRYPARDAFLGFLTVSEHSRKYLQLAFPGASVSRIRLGIGRDLFNPDAADRPKRITYMPRRGRDDAALVLGILKGRKSMQGWEIVALDGLSHSEVARELRSSRIFLAFTRHEGFGLPAAEAMACGNFVIGNHGFGGEEFFRSEFSRTVESGNILDFVHAAEEAVQKENESPGWCEERGRLAADFILSNYAPENAHRDVVRFYSGLLERMPERQAVIA